MILALYALRVCLCAFLNMKSNIIFKNILNFPFLEELMDETGPPEADNELAVDVQDKYFKFESPAPDQMGTKKQIVVKSDKNSPNIFRFGSAPPKVKSFKKLVKLYF